MDLSISCRGHLTYSSIHTKTPLNTERVQEAVKIMTHEHLGPNMIQAMPLAAIDGDINIHRVARLLN